MANNNDTFTTKIVQPNFKLSTQKRKINIIIKGG